MDKYIGNKKRILQNLENFMLSKNIKSGLLVDPFTGTTNIAQYFKQRGFDVVSNDINIFSFVLQKAYIENNEFPEFKILLEKIKEKDFIFEDEKIKSMENQALKKLKDKIFSKDYGENLNYIHNIQPLIKVIYYLNSLSVENLNREQLFFFDHYTQGGNRSEFISMRKTKGKRNYFNEYNGKKLGVLLFTLKNWKQEEVLTEQEFYILLTSIIEEVNLVANVNGTFHDFNRNKLYPNALVNMELKPPALNISSVNQGYYKSYCQDSNLLYNDADFQNFNNGEIEVLYLDPPYNFRQYTAYYHFLNLIGKYHEILDIVEYGENLSFVRGQNMEDDFSSDYCYKESFGRALKDLIASINAKHVIISYYDENNHWNHGKEVKSMEGRNVILDILRDQNLFSSYDTEPHMINRQNYQSQGGHSKKDIDELVFYGKRVLPEINTSQNDSDIREISV